MFKALKKSIILFWSEVFQLFKESLTGDNNKYSSKKLTMFVYSNLGVLMILLDLYFRKGQLNYEAFLLVLGMATGQTIISLLDKKVNDSIPIPDKKITEVTMTTTETATKE